MRQTRTDARYKIADCLTKSASIKSAEVSPQVISQAHWRITAEDTMLETRREERARGQEGFVKKRARAEYADATSFWKNANTEVRTLSHLPSAYLKNVGLTAPTYGNLDHLCDSSEDGA